ncbi:class E sortase [uncultured Bifidobacterium sp.]|uniref:class E sortase n=2 Tax=uncultured Bifidobacterium sp. TaxID=165187 RepID=UPI0025869016|nr:class E sortase [uncultured Bifidobacterium sp.]
MRHGVQRGYRTTAGTGQGGRRHGVLWGVLGILMELLFTLAAVCALYIVWQMWWTGVQAEHEQVEARQSVSWQSPVADDDQTAIAPKQEGEPPVQPENPLEGDLIAQIYIPRFGDQWERNIVEGTTLEQLNRHGMGHYTTSQMPGQVGNFAVAGHRNGYGQPLGDVDKLQEGDAIVIRTQNYWYVYHYTSYEIVTPDRTDVVAANPEDPGAEPVKRMITLTTCEPKYTAATHRWISYGEFDYWAKVSDGVPAELTTTDASGTVRFINTRQPSAIERLGSMRPIVIAALIAYVVIFLAAAVAWRWPVLREIREGRRPRPEVSIYGWVLRHQPGVAPIRWLLLLLLIVAAAAALLEWGYPWLAANIPYLRDMSNYVAV